MSKFNNSSFSDAMQNANINLDDFSDENNSKSNSSFSDEHLINIMTRVNPLRNYASETAVEHKDQTGATFIQIAKVNDDVMFINHLDSALSINDKEVPVEVINVTYKLIGGYIDIRGKHINWDVFHTDQIQEAITNEDYETVYTSLLVPNVVIQRMYYNEEIKVAVVLSYYYSDINDCKDYGTDGIPKYTDPIPLVSIEFVDCNNPYVMQVSTKSVIDLDQLNDGGVRCDMNIASTFDIYHKMYTTAVFAGPEIGEPISRLSTDLARCFVQKMNVISNFNEIDKTTRAVNELIDSLKDYLDLSNVRLNRAFKSYSVLEDGINGDETGARFSEIQKAYAEKMDQLGKIVSTGFTFNTNYRNWCDGTVAEITDADVQVEEPRELEPEPLDNDEGDLDVM